MYISRLKKGTKEPRFCSFIWFIIVARRFSWYVQVMMEQISNARENRERKITLGDFLKSYVRL